MGATDDVNVRRGGGLMFRSVYRPAWRRKDTVFWRRLAMTASFFKAGELKVLPVVGFDPTTIRL